jgi:hypothetical protein
LESAAIVLLLLGFFTIYVWFALQSAGDREVTPIGSTITAVVKEEAVESELSPLAVMALMVDYMIYAGVLSSIQLGWSGTMNEVLVATTMASGTQIEHVSPVSCIIAPYPAAVRSSLVLLALMVMCPVALMLTVAFASKWGRLFPCRRRLHLSVAHGVQFDADAESESTNLPGAQAGAGEAVGLADGDAVGIARVDHGRVLGYFLSEWANKAVLVAAVLFQPTVVKHVFTLFPTTSIAGTDFMVSDMSVKAGSSERGAVLLFAVSVVIVYVLGLPLVLMLVLCNARSQLAPSLAFMFSSFKPDQRYWAVVQVLRKTLLTAVVSLVQKPWQQLYVGLWIMALSTVWHRSARPYAHPKLQQIETTSLSATTFIFALSLAIPFDVNYQSVVQIAIGVVEVGTLLWFVNLVATLVVRTAQHKRTARRRNQVRGGFDDMNLPGVSSVPYEQLS